MGEEPRNVEPDEEIGTAAGRHEGEAKERGFRRRAYAIWEREGRPDGRALDHWLRAQWEVENVPEGERERLEHEFGPGPDRG